MKFAPYRKMAVAVFLGAAEAAAYIVANPKHVPGWVVGGALAINAAAVYYVRNTPAPVPPRG